MSRRDSAPSAPARGAADARSFADILAIIRTHRAGALASVNVEHLLSRWEIGGYLSGKIKRDGWGQATIDNLVDYIHANAPGVRGLVAFELKAREFRPADMGQLEFYLEALDRDVKRADENPSVGVLLCKSADHATVEYALSRTMSSALVAEYRRVMIPREVLRETFDRYLAGEEAGK